MSARNLIEYRLQNYLRQESNLLVILSILRVKKKSRVRVVLYRESRAARPARGGGCLDKIPRARDLQGARQGQAASRRSL